MNLAFAYRLRRVLVRRVGTPAGDGLVAHPTARQVASLDVADLTRAQFSRRKAEYVVETARAIDAGRLPLDALSQRPAPIVEQTLLDVRGIGPWSANYLMMRGLGFADCVPAGDSGLSAALQRFFSLEERPDAAAQRELMEAFAPYRSLATFHLWLSLGDAP